MTLDEYEKLPPEEREHFYRCSKCGQFVDKRELRDVIFHETDHKPNPRIPRIKGERISRYPGPDLRLAARILSRSPLLKSMGRAKELAVLRPLNRLQ